MQVVTITSTYGCIRYNAAGSLDKTAQVAILENLMGSLEITKAVL
jgi:hypothetical protein